MVDVNERATAPLPGRETAADSDGEVERCRALLDELMALPAGDPRRPALRGRVIEAFVPLADRLARRYSRGRAEEDLTQVARLGLLKAVDGFKPELGAFVGYAVPTIQGELKRYFRDRCWDIRAPRRLQELRAAVHTAEQVLSQRLGRSPTVAEVAAEVGAPAGHVLEALDCDRAYTVASLNAPARDGEGTCEVGDLMGGVDAVLEATADRVSLGPALARLPDRERRVIIWRFFDHLTQSQIAERLGISQMHVSRLLARTLDGLRAWIEGERPDVEVCRARRRPGRPAAA
jgi:RNA polymerase sigma-B factor